jgi:predicted O-methyltransferase YrrM
VVGGYKKGSVVWIEKFSFDAVSRWHAPIDFLFIDGDHSEAGVNQDWENWHRFVVPGGVVAFHDASTFPGGWPEADWGPVRLVNRLFRDHGLAEWTLVEVVDSLVVVERLKKGCESKSE